jgi:hypothetical protein
MPKPRTDRNHIIYEIVTPVGSYIGVTAKTQTTVLKSLELERPSTTIVLRLKPRHGPYASICAH